MNKKKSKVAVTKRRTRVGRNKKVALVRSPNVTPAGQKYFRCALNPFEGGGGAKIPDGSGLRTICVEYQVSVTIIPVAGDTTGSIAFFMYPGLPGALMVTQGTVSTFSNAGVTFTYSASCLTGGPQVPIIVMFQDEATGAATGGGFYDHNTRKYTRARAVSWGMEVRPTGPILLTQGQAATARLPIYFGEGALPQRTLGPITYGSSLTATQSALVRAANFSLAGFQNASSYPSAKICPVAETCRVLGRAGEAGTQFHPVETLYRDGPMGNVLNNTILVAREVGTDYVLTSSVPPAAFDLAGGGQNGFGVNAWFGVVPNGVPLVDMTKGLQGHYWLPRGHEMIVYTANGLAATYAIEVKACMCIEAEVNQSSPFRGMSSIGPPRDDRSLRAVSDIQVKLPPSVPLAEPAGNWWNTIFGVVEGVGSTLAEFGIPVVSPVAGMVGKLASAINRVL